MNLTDQLAHALARAVSEETEKLANAKPGHELPSWYQDAAFALWEFCHEKRQQLLDRIRIY